MKRALLTSALLCLVGLSGPSASNRSDLEGEPILQSRPIAIDKDGNLLFTHTTPPPGLVDPVVVIGEDGTLAVTNVPAPPGLVNPTVTITEDGTLTVTNVPAPPGLVDPTVTITEDGTLTVTTAPAPPGLANPRIVIDEQGNYLERTDGPALGVTGALVLMALMLILGGYALARRRTVQVS